MAIDFNGTTSKLQHTTANLGLGNLYTICANVFADGIGEVAGRIITVPEDGITTNGLWFGHHTTANNLRLDAAFTTTDGSFLFSVLDGQWHSVAISYDASSVSNLPVARLNFAPVTVNTSITPVGTHDVPSTGYCVGNAANATRTWDGMIQHVQVFNVVLTAGEMDQANRRPGSVRRGLKLWLPMLHAGHLVDWSGNGFNATATALADRVGGPACAPLFSSMLPSFQDIVVSVPPQEWNIPPAFRPNRKRRVVVSGIRPAY